MDFASFPHSFTFAMFARLFALALYVNCARFTDEKVGERGVRTPSWASVIAANRSAKYFYSKISKNVKVIGNVFAPSQSRHISNAEG